MLLVALRFCLNTTALQMGRNSGRPTREAAQHATRTVREQLCAGVSPSIALQLEEDQERGADQVQAVHRPAKDGGAEIRRQQLRFGELSC